MLTKDPEKRITAEKALKHPWFGLITEIKLVSTVKKEQMVKSATWKKLTRYTQGSLLKRCAIELLINMLSNDEKENIEKEFNKFDTTKSGVVSHQTFIDIVKDQKPDMLLKEVKRMAKELDFDDNKEIKYKDFMVATIDIKKALTKDRLQTIFSKFDIDSNHMITEENLIDAIDNLGFTVSKSKAGDIIKQYDSSNSGFISKNDFKAMITKS